MQEKRKIQESQSQSSTSEMEIKCVAGIYGFRVCKMSHEGIAILCHLPLLEKSPAIFNCKMQLNLKGLNTVNSGRQAALTARHLQN